MQVSIDMGGTNTRIAISPDLKKVESKVRFYTHDTWDEQFKLLRKNILEISEGKKIESLCFLLPARLDKKNQKVIKAPNCGYFDGVTFEKIISELQLECPFVIDNDAAGAGVAEAIIGAGEPYDLVGYITLGTGVGGSYVSKSKNSFFYLNAEPGHQIIHSSNGRVSSRCQQQGCLESYASGKSFEEIYKQPPAETTDTKIWEDYAKNLSIGLINSYVFWGYEILILGGSLSNKYNEFMPYLKKELEKDKYVQFPEIKKSLIGDFAGVLGGFFILKQKLFSK